MDKCEYSRCARGKGLRIQLCAPPISMISGAACACAMASIERVGGRRMPSRGNCGSRVTTMFVRPGSGLPIDSNVLRPIDHPACPVLPLEVFEIGRQPPGQLVCLPMTRLRARGR